MFVAITAGFSLAIYLWLSNISNKALPLNECYSYNRFQLSKLSISDF